MNEKLNSNMQLDLELITIHLGQKEIELLVLQSAYTAAKKRIEELEAQLAAKEEI
jgi:hypothetical protein